MSTDAVIIIGALIAIARCCVVLSSIIISLSRETCTAGADVQPSDQTVHSPAFDVSCDP